MATQGLQWKWLKHQKQNYLKSNVIKSTSIKGASENIILFPDSPFFFLDFIQLNHIDEWTKIQSGSIYYALGKLEKQGYIKVIEEKGTGKKARKVYAITDAGHEVLNDYVKEKLEMPT